MDLTFARAAAVKRAELLSTVGAGVLGAGLALAFGASLRPYGPAVLAAGLLAHVVGMVTKHRLELRAGLAQPPWAAALYWACWAVLAVLAGLIAVDVL